MVAIQDTPNLHETKPEVLGVFRSIRTNDGTGNSLELLQGIDAVTDIIEDYAGRDKQLARQIGGAAFWLAQNPCAQRSESVNHHRGRLGTLNGVDLRFWQFTPHNQSDERTHRRLNTTRVLYAPLSVGQTRGVGILDILTIENFRKRYN